MFSVDRIFSVNNPKSGLPEWYFQAREGDVGPYKTRAEATAMLQSFIKKCIDMGYTGGRGKDENPLVALEIQTFVNNELAGAVHWY